MFVTGIVTLGPAPLHAPSLHDLIEHALQANKHNPWTRAAPGGIISDVCPTQSVDARRAAVSDVCPTQSVDARRAGGIISDVCPTQSVDARRAGAISDVWPASGIAVRMLHVSDTAIVRFDPAVLADSIR